MKLKKRVKQLSKRISALEKKKKNKTAKPEAAEPFKVGE